MRSRLFAAAAVILGGAALLQTIEFGGGLAGLLAAPAAAAEGEDAEAQSAAQAELDNALSFPEQIGASADEYRILISLQQRRRELEQWEAEIETRAQTVEAAEARVEERLAELRGVREEIGALLGELDAQEETRVASLVTTYERMEAKDAARILAALETETSLLVMSRMRQQSLAGVLGEMSTEDARRITEMLAARADLRSVVGESGGGADTADAAPDAGGEPTTDET